MAAGDVTGASDPAALPDEWAPVFVLTGLFFLNFTARIISAPLLPAIERDLGLSHGQAGMFFVMIASGYFPAMLGSGYVSARFRHCWTIVLSCAIVGGSLVVVSLAQNLSAIHSGLFGIGLGAGLYIPSAIATITSLVNQRHWGKAIAIHEVAPNLAFVAAPLTSELVLQSFSWRFVLFWLGAFCLLASFSFATFGKGGDFPGEMPASQAFRQLARLRSFWIMIVLFTLGIAATLGIFAMLPLYLVDARGMDRNWANTLLGLSRVACPFVGLLAGWASDRFGPKQTIGVTLLLSGLATISLGWLWRKWLILFVFLQPAISVGFFPAGFAALSAISTRTARNAAVSFAIPLAFVCGAGAVPWLLGITGDLGLFSIGFSLVGTLILGGAVLACRLEFSRR